MTVSRLRNFSAYLRPAQDSTRIDLLCPLLGRMIKQMGEEHQIICSMDTEGPRFNLHIKPRRTGELKPVILDSTELDGPTFSTRQLPVIIIIPCKKI